MIWEVLPVHSDHLHLHLPHFLHCYCHGKRSNVIDQAIITGKVYTCKVCFPFVWKVLYIHELVTILPLNSTLEENTILSKGTVFRICLNNVFCTMAVVIMRVVRWVQNITTLLMYINNLICFLHCFQCSMNMKLHKKGSQCCFTGRCLQVWFQLYTNCRQYNLHVTVHAYHSIYKSLFHQRCLFSLGMFKPCIENLFELFSLWLFSEDM